MIRALGLSILFFIAVNASNPNEPSTACQDESCLEPWMQLVYTTLGPVVGTKMTKTYPGNRPVTSFYHIPVGKDTSGINRFKLPQVRDPWSPFLDVTDINRIKAFSCLQINPSNISIPQGTEDCLGVHVYTPSDKFPTRGAVVDDDDLLPVIVYIYGGSYMSGDGKFYNPTRLLDEDVVLIAINYRVGPLGFFTDFTDEAPGNQALFDQLLCMTWVRDNARFFGGNPGLVTLMGESAGGLSVGHHVISPLSRGLFHRAVIHSVAPLSPFGIEENPIKEYAFLSQQTGCPVDPNNEATYPAFTYCLRQIPPYTLFLLHAYFSTLEHRGGHHGMCGNSPVIQKNPGTPHFITEDSLFPLAQGDFSKVPILMGSNKHDGTFVVGIFFNDYIDPLNKAENPDFWSYEAIDIFMEMMEIYDESHIVNPSLKQSFISRLNGSVYEDLKYGYVDFLGASILKGPINRFAELTSEKTDVYLYSFDYEGQYTLWTSFFSAEALPPVPHGVAHGDELLYLFAYPADQNSLDSQQTRNMVKTWVNFARTGNPTPDGPTELPAWPKYSEKVPLYMKIGEQWTVSEDYTQELIVSVSDKLQGKLIPGDGQVLEGMNKHLRTISRERMDAFDENLKNGKSVWDKSDERAFIRQIMAKLAQEKHDGH